MGQTSHSSKMSQPHISIVIPVRNEELLLGACLDAIMEAVSQLDAALEIIVVINRCTDRSQEIAQERGCRVIFNDSKNLAQIRNAGAACANGEILVTIDADSRMSKNMLRMVSNQLKRPEVIGGGVLLLPERWSLGIFLTGLCLVPIALRHRVSGGLFFCRLEDFQAIGGFNEALASVEDIDFAKRLRAYGRKTKRRFVTLFRAQIVTSCRKFDRLGDWYFLRNPRLFMSLLHGRNQAAADRIWYDFPR